MTARKLTDLQLILLTTAAQREDGSLLPPPERLGDQTARIRKPVPPLLKRRLVEEVPLTEADRIWRDDGDAKLGLAITAAGRTLVASEAAEQPQPVETAAALVEPVPPAPMPAAKPATKIAAVLGMLHRETGATLVELTKATGWLPHTARAALTGLRKKGHVIGKATRGDATTYLIVAGA